MMKFLRGLVISLLSFLLFLSLAVFGTVFALSNTLLNPDFVATQVNRLDIPSLARELTEEQVGGQLPPEAEFVEEALYSTIADREPWLKQQASTAIYSFYDFLLGKSERLSLAISLEPLKEDVREKAWQLFQQNAPPQLSGLPQAEIEKYFNQFYQDFSGQIPSEFKLDESLLPPEVMAQIMLARYYIGYVQTAYYALIGLMVLLGTWVTSNRRD